MAFDCKACINVGFFPLKNKQKEFIDEPICSFTPMKLNVETFFFIKLNCVVSPSIEVGCEGCWCGRPTKQGAWSQRLGTLSGCQPECSESTTCVNRRHWTECFCIQAEIKKLIWDAIRGKHCFTTSSVVCLYRCFSDRPMEFAVFPW